jgi:uncharacterized integral membrane protein (TIGR00698 family)
MAGVGVDEGQFVNGLRRLGPGLLLVAVAVGLSFAVNQLLGVVSALIVAILLGAVVRNAGLLPSRALPGVAFSARRLLRAGVVLLGLQLSVPVLLDLRPGDLVTVTATVIVTFAVTRWLGRRFGLGRDGSLLMATGFSICGAAAIAAVSSVTKADDEDAATSVAMVTLYGTVAIVIFPALQPLLGFTDQQFGVWVGASIHEVGQVVAAAAVAGETALVVAVVAKLGRVVYLAPMVIAIGATRRRGGDGDAMSAAPILPLFVAGFIATATLRSVGVVPEAVVDVANVVTTVLLTAAMFGLGTGIDLRALARTGTRAAALGAVATFVAALTAYAGLRLFS